MDENINNEMSTYMYVNAILVRSFGNRKSYSYPLLLSVHLSFRIIFYSACVEHTVGQKCVFFLELYNYSYKLPLKIFFMIISS